MKATGIWIDFKDWRPKRGTLDRTGRPGL